MYNEGSAEFNNLIEKSGGQSLKPRLVFKNFTIENIIKLEYYGGSNNSDDIAIGTTPMSYVDVEIVTDKIITNEEFLLEAGFLINEQYEYAPIGYFTVQLPETDEDVVSFKAYDRMQKFEKSYISSLTFPTTDDKIVAEVCSKCGVQLATPIVKPITMNEMLQGYTCREILGYIAGIHGFFSCIDRHGKLHLRWYEEIPIEKPISLIWSLTKGQNNHTINKIVMVKDSETTYTCGSGTTSINVSNPLATQQIADDVYKALNGYTYRPTNISMLDDIRLDPWDAIKVTYFDGNVYIVPAMILEHSLTNCETRISAVGKTEVENEYSYLGPVTTALERTATELLIANRIIATKVDAEWVRANTITVDELDATNARIGELEANSLTATEADLKYANITLGNIDAANINKANIGSLFAEVGLLTSATIMNGHVTGYLDSVEVNANSITTGTLITDRLVFRGQEKSIVYELNNITGALQAVQSDTLNGEILTNRSITVDKIVANSITSNEIAAGTITAFNIASQAITTDIISANAITTDKIAANAITTDKMTVGNGGNIYATGYDTFENIPNIASRIYYNKAAEVSASIDETTAYYGGKCLKITSTNKNTNGRVCLGDASNGYGCIPVVAGETYIVSAWMKASEQTNVLFGVVGHETKNNAYSATAGIEASIGTTWARVYLRYKATSTYPYISIRASNNSSNTTLWVDAIQIETGTAKQEPSTFTPASTTNIDGANIYTGTVTADKITANSLSAISANLGTVKIGGSGNGNGVLEIYDATNKLLIKGDNTGLATTKMINVNDNSQSIVFSRTAYSYGGAMYGLSGIRIGNLELGEGSDYYTEQIDGGYIGGLSKIFTGETFDIMMGNSRYNVKSILTGYYGTPDSGGIAPVKAKFYGDVSGEEISGQTVEGGVVKTTGGANLDTKLGINEIGVITSGVKTLNVASGDIVLISFYGSGGTTMLLFIYSSQYFLTLSKEGLQTHYAITSLGDNVTLSNGILSIIKTANLSQIYYMHYRIG